MMINLADGPKGLKEMDMVLLRDGRIGLVLYNSTKEEMSIFGCDLWYISSLYKYNNNFEYDKNANENYYDIVAISRQKTYWHTLNRIYNYKTAIRFNDLDELKQAFEDFDWHQTYCFEKFPELAVDDLIIDIHYFDNSVPRFIGYIKSNKFDPDECFNLCNWSNWSETKPENLYADIQSVGKGICFTDPITNEKHLALSMGWLVGNSMEITDYVRKNIGNPFWKR